MLLEEYLARETPGDRPDVMGRDDSPSFAAHTTNHEHHAEPRRHVGSPLLSGRQSSGLSARQARIVLTAPNPGLALDGVLSPAGVNHDFAELVAKLGPFGAGNAEPRPASEYPHPLCARTARRSAQRQACFMVIMTRRC